MLGCCQKFTPKPSNIAELKPQDCLAVDMEWFATGVHWLGNPVISQETWFSCVAAAGEHFEHNVQFKYREGSWPFVIETFELSGKKLCKIGFVITEISGLDCVFTWKSEL